jgi:hypothetical protein
MAAIILQLLLYVRCLLAGKCGELHPAATAAHAAATAAHAAAAAHTAATAAAHAAATTAAHTAAASAHSLSPLFVVS